MHRVPLESPPAQTDLGGGASAAFTLIIYAVAFVVGAIVMGFEMLGSRYLNPYFGSGIYTWAALISTVLAALCIGYFVGGWLADRRPRAAVLGVTVLIGSVYLLFLPLFSEAVLESLLASFDDIRTGSLASSFAIMFFPVTFLGMYSPFAIRLLLRATHGSGTVSGMVYGISTFGSIVGTLGTTFWLIPLIGTRAITISLGAAGVLAGLLLIVSDRNRRDGRERPDRGAASSRALRPCPRTPRTCSTTRRAPPCSLVATAASPMSRPSTTTSSSPSRAIFSPCRFR